MANILKSVRDSIIQHNLLNIWSVAIIWFTSVEIVLIVAVVE